MKKILSTALIVIMIFTVVTVTIAPQPVHAGTGAMSCFEYFGGFNVGACLTEAAAWVGNIMLSLVAWLVTITATFLSISLKITINIKELYDKTESIKLTWVVIRNISSMFIIFLLIYTSIETILDIGKTNVKELVGKIIMAGLLINFSLFFTQVAIDASNLISLEFYRAIAPQYSSTAGIGTLGSAYFDGGISNIFMSSLKLQNIYHPDNSGISNAKAETNIFMSIIIGTYGGIILMLFAAISFLGAAVMFTIRTGVLLLLMAFSPVYFVGMIFPNVKKDVSDEWFKMLTQQLMFMPVYLLLMYVALRIISDPQFLSFIQDGKQTTDPGNTMFNQIGIAIRYIIAILFINAPLVAGIKLGGIGAGFAADMTDGLKKNARGYLAQHTVGRAAKSIQGSIAKSDWAAKNPNLAVLTNKTLGNVAGAEFGGTKGGFEKRNKDFVKERTEFANKSIKLNDDNKREATLGVPATLATQMSEWDEETKNMNREAKEADKEYKAAKVKYDAATIIGDPSAEKKGEEFRAAKKKLDELNNKLASRGVSGREAYSEQKNKELKEAAEAKALKDKKEAFAAALANGKNPWTSDARKEAAGSIRKELAKGKKDKLIDAIKELEADEKPSAPPAGGSPKT